MFFNATSIVGAESCAQVTTNGKGFTHFFPIQSKSQAFEGLLNLINEYGVPEHIITDGAREEGGVQAWKTNWQKLIKRFYIRQGVIQPYCWWQNSAERKIGEIRKDIRKYTSQRNSPRRLWSFLGSYVAMKRSFTSKNRPASMGKSGYELVTGEVPDITLYATIGWYDWVYYRDSSTKEKKIGRNLGPCGRGIGGGDCYHVLTEKATSVMTNTVLPIGENKMSNRDLTRRMDLFDKYIEEKIGNKIKKSKEQYAGFPDYGDIFEERSEDLPTIVEEESLIPDIEDRTKEEYDKHIGAEVLIDVGGESRRAVVKSRARDQDGNPIGQRNDNYILDTREYEVQFEDGATNIYSSNIIMENIYLQIDKEGNMFVLMDEIVDHRKDPSALDKSKGTYITKTGTVWKKITTKGWEI